VKYLYQNQIYPQKKYHHIQITDHVIDAIQKLKIILKWYETKLLELLNFKQQKVRILFYKLINFFKSYYIEQPLSNLTYKSAINSHTTPKNYISNTSKLDNYESLRNSILENARYSTTNFDLVNSLRSKYFV
jgi:hypothetical protein